MIPYTHPKEAKYENEAKSSSFAFVSLPQISCSVPLECTMQRLRGSGTLFSRSSAVTQLRKKAFRSWGAIQDTYFSTKDIFESHKVVFTIGTSIASVATAWIGYTLRHMHESRVDQRLRSIETAMKNNHNLEQSEIKNIMSSGSIGLPSCIATAGTTLVIGYALGWRGGRWYSSRKLRREQLRLLGQTKPKRWPLLKRIEPGWQFQFLRRPLSRRRTPENAAKTSEKLKDTPSPNNLENPINLVKKHSS